MKGAGPELGGDDPRRVRGFLRYSVKKASRIAVPLLVLAVILPASSQAASSRAEYVAQADPICAAANSSIAKLNKKFIRFHKRGRYRAAGTALGKTGTLLSASLAQVRAIAPPPGDEATVASWLALIDAVVADN